MPKSIDFIIDLQIIANFCKLRQDIANQVVSSTYEYYQCMLQLEVDLTKFLMLAPREFQNVLQSLLDPQALRNLRFIIPNLRNCNLKEGRFKQFSLILRENAEK